MANNSEIRLGIVGMRLGLWHAGAIAKIDGASIAAVADNVPGKLPGPDISLGEWADTLGADALRTPTWLDVYTEKGQALVTGIDHMFDTLTWGSADASAPTREHWPNPPLRTLIVQYAPEEFVMSVRTGRQPESNADAGLKAQALAMAVNESVASGRSVDLSW